MGQSRKFAGSRSRVSNARALWIVASLTPMGSSFTFAQETATDFDKRGYTLFNPTPREFMREMSTDRPDTTESPFTVDAGHVQIEMSFVEYVRDGDADEFSVAPTNFKVGLLNNADLQLVFEPLLIQRNGDDTEGVGSTQVRLKVNLWGNDKGCSALALMPFIKFPTESNGVGNNEFEGGLIVPFAIELSEGWTTGLMAEFDAVYDQADDEYDLEFVHTCTIGHDITEALAGYVEYIGIAGSDGDTRYQALLGGGLTYALSADLRLDVGINIGLSDAAADVNPFVGMSIRF